MIDVDKGGVAVVQRVLDVCSEHGLWAFAQLGRSVKPDGEEHDGGHVYIPVSGRHPGIVLRGLARSVQAAAGAQGETFPHGNMDLRAPLMLHLRAPGGPTRFLLLLQTGDQIDAHDPWAALAILRSVWEWNSGEALTTALGILPDLATKQPAKRHTSKVNPRNAASVIAWYNSSHGLRELLHDRGVSNADRARVVHCPWHDDRSPSLVIFDHPDGHEVCHCFSAHSGC